MGRGRSERVGFVTVEMRRTSGGTKRAQEIRKVPRGHFESRDSSLENERQTPTTSCVSSVFTVFNLTYGKYGVECRRTLARATA